MKKKDFNNYLTGIWGFIRFSPGITVGVMMFLIILTLGFVVSLFAPFDPQGWNYVPKNLPPSSEYLLGTNSIGQDVFWYLTYAIKNSLIMGFIASVVSLLIGTLLGLIAGYKGGSIDKLILFISDTNSAIPDLPIMILISTMLANQMNIIILGLVIALLNWSGPVRNIRSIVLSLREREFTHTAQFSGFKPFNIIISEYIPHTLPWMTASFISRIMMAIGMEVTLAIFGLSSLQDATLGTMINWALSYQALLRGLWWWILAPVILVVLLVLSLYMVSVGVSEYLHPRIKQHS